MGEFITALLSGGVLLAIWNILFPIIATCLLLTINSKLNLIVEFLGKSKKEKNENDDISYLH